LIRLRLKDHRAFAPFISKCFQTREYWSAVSEGLSGSAQGGFNASKLAALTVPLPPLAQQRRIVAILDEAFAVIARAVAATEKNLANARELFESYLDSVFAERRDAPCVLLHDVCEIKSSLVDPREQQYADLPHVGGGNIETKTGRLTDLKTAKEEGLVSGKFLFDSSIVLYSKIRPYLMKVARPDFVGLCSADIYPLAPKSGKLDRSYLYYMLLSATFTNYAVSGSARAGMPKVNRDHLFAYRTNVPLIEIQIDLARRFDNLAVQAQRLESLYRRKLAALAELKQSLLQKAFAGDLTTDFSVKSAVEEAVA
jgi:type I restriction enzyme S subunit